MKYAAAALLICSCAATEPMMTRSECIASKAPPNYYTPKCMMYGENCVVSDDCCSGICQGSGFDRTCAPGRPRP